MLSSDRLTVSSNQSSTLVSLTSLSIVLRRRDFGAGPTEKLFDVVALGPDKTIGVAEDAFVEFIPHLTNGCVEALRPVPQPRDKRQRARQTQPVNLILTTITIIIINYNGITGYRFSTLAYR